MRGGDMSVYEDEYTATWVAANTRKFSPIFICSSCKEKAYYPQKRNKEYMKNCGYSHCPNCGKRMVSEYDGLSCRECDHFEACSRWTDFPKHCGIPTCSHFKSKNRNK